MGISLQVGPEAKKNTTINMLQKSDSHNHDLKCLNK